MSALTSRLTLSGFSLIEIMIALLLGSLLTTVVVSLFVNNSRAFQETSQYGQMQENGRYAIRALTQDLRQVSYWGQSVNTGIKNTVKWSVGDDCPIPAQAYYLANDVATQPTDSSGLWSTRLTKAQYGGANCITDAMPDSDLLVIKGVTGPVLDLKTLDFNQLDDTKAYLLGNPSIALLAPGDITAYPTELGGSPQGTAWEYVEWLYYVADADLPGLQRLNLSADTRQREILVDGVEQMRLQFGIDRNADGGPDFFTTGAVIDADPDIAWSQVVATRIYLLMRSIEDPFQHDEKVYLLGNDPTNKSDLVTPTAKNYYRIVISGQVEVRNQHLTATGSFQ